MIILPDEAKIEMTWKEVRYTNHQHYLIFQIIPMLEQEDLILMPGRNWFICI